MHIIPFFLCQCRIMTVCTRHTVYSCSVSCFTVQCFKICYSTTVLLSSHLKNTALQADDHLAYGRCIQRSQVALVLIFFLPYWSALSHSCLLIIAIDVILPADSRQPLDTFHFKNKQCLGYKEQSWEYACIKLYLILLIFLLHSVFWVNINSICDGFRQTATFSLMSRPYKYMKLLMLSRMLPFSCLLPW